MAWNRYRLLFGRFSFGRRLIFASGGTGVQRRVQAELFPRVPAQGSCSRRQSRKNVGRAVSEPGIQPYLPARSFTCDQHLRPRSRAVSAQTRRGTRCERMGAHQLGRRDSRDCREVHELSRRVWRPSRHEMRGEWELWFDQRRFHEQVLQLHQCFHHGAEP